MIFHPKTFFAAIASILSMAASPSWAADLGQIPNEYEATSGYGIGMNNAGFAANEPHTAVRANPALLPSTKDYSIAAGYHWPTTGREFFQASVVDAKTSPIAAGLTYTGYMDDYLDPTEVRSAPRYDSPIIRRGSIGAGQNFGSMSAGIGATYVEAHPTSSSEAALRGDTRVKGIGLNLGLAMPWTPSLTFGASVENATNKKIADYAPKTYRAGAAYSFNKNVSGYLDFRQRDRVAEFESTAPVDINATNEPEKLDPEQMVLASVAAKVQDFLRLMGSYGQAIGDDRRSLAGGVSIMNRSFSLSYTASRPYVQNNSAAHQAVSLSLAVAM
jgi:hypothetical protein